ncbi:MAG: hypothetical protein K9M45_00665 [Kiritimatiellales bacterium]|nr:hypothetical protein [Kiritimatiellales bacterium]
MKRLVYHLCLALSFTASAGAAFDGDPFYERMTGTNDMTYLAVRPFYSHVENPEKEKEIRDYIWPLYTRKTFKDEKYGRLLFFGFSHDFSQEEDDVREQNWILPIYFQGKDAADNGYFAIFPVGGTIHDFLGRDKIMFVLFPIFGKSSINEVKTTTVLWPIGSKTEGGKVERFRVFPIVGKTQLDGEYDKRFVLWPFWNSVDYLNEENEGHSWMLFPICGKVDKEKEKTMWVVPPLFRFSRGEEQTITYCPWPFYQTAEGEVNKFIMWPLFGKKQIGGIQKDYYAWPLLWSTTVDYPKFTHKRKMLAPVFAYESDRAVRPIGEDIGEGDVFSRYWKLWPVMSWQREHDVSRFRMVELWPFRNTPAVERNWAPIWTLYKRECGESETGHHVLWGTYRQIKRPDEFEWSLLKGLIAYKRKGPDKQFRMLFVPFAEDEVSP